MSVIVGSGRSEVKANKEPAKKEEQAKKPVKSPKKA